MKGWSSHPTFWTHYSLETRAKRNNHRPRRIWFTGLSGAGKSTIAKQPEKQLFDEARQVVRMDKDNVRYGLNGDLGFSRDKRQENTRRARYPARQLYDFGNIVLCTFVGPYRKDREYVRSLFPEGDFVEVYVDIILGEARRRDPKRLYANLDAGDISGFTAVDEPFEASDSPELRIDTGSETVELAVKRIYRHITIAIGTKTGK